MKWDEVLFITLSPENFVKGISVWSNLKNQLTLKKYEYEACHLGLLLDEFKKEEKKVDYSFIPSVMEIKYYVKISQEHVAVYEYIKNSLKKEVNRIMF